MLGLIGKTERGVAVCSRGSGQRNSWYVPLHSAGQVGFGQIATFGVVAAAVGSDALEVGYHDGLAFAWNEG